MKTLSGLLPWSRGLTGATWHVWLEFDKTSGPSLAEAFQNTPKVLLML
jgi:hypothetical protein